MNNAARMSNVQICLEIYRELASDPDNVRFVVDEYQKQTSFWFLHLNQTPLGNLCEQVFLRGITQEQFESFTKAFKHRINS